MIFASRFVLVQMQFRYARNMLLLIYIYIYIAKDLRALGARHHTADKVDHSRWNAVFARENLWPRPQEPLGFPDSAKSPSWAQRPDLRSIPFNGCSEQEMLHPIPGEAALSLAASPRGTAVAPQEE